MRVERAEALTDLGLGGSGFDAAPGRGVIKIVFNIVGGDAESFCPGKCSYFCVLHFVAFFCQAKISSTSAMETR